MANNLQCHGFKIVEIKTHKRNIHSQIKFKMSVSITTNSRGETAMGITQYIRVVRYNISGVCEAQITPLTAPWFFIRYKAHIHLEVILKSELTFALYYVTLDI